MTERPPQNPESHKHEPTEMVLSDFKRICQGEIGVIHTPEEKDQVIGVMHQTLERLDNKEMIHKYREGRIPTIHSLELAANEAIEHLRAEQPDEEIERISKLLEGQVRSIRGWTRRYVGTVVKFHLMKSAYYAQEEEADKFITADSERRRVHDALLSSIASFSKLLSEAQEITHYPLRLHGTFPPILRKVQLTQSLLSFRYKQFRTAILYETGLLQLTVLKSFKNLLR